MTDKTVHSGSLQFYPRKRARKMLPSVNWDPVTKEKGLMGFIGYKVGMCSVFVRDNTPDSLTKGKRIIVPATIIECPSLKIFSVRFYKDKKVLKDFVVSNDKELKKKVKVPKEVKKIDSVPENYDDLRLIVYSEVKKTSIKKTPDMIEVGVAGTKEEKLNFAKEHINKGISVHDVFENGLVDIRAVTKGYGLQGPVKRFGITLKSHKSEKGQRRPGSLAPWHPARVTFRAPMAGQTGLFSRVSYNQIILEVGKISEKDINKKSGFHKYGKIKNDYLILKGSIPGSKKRALMITSAIRPSKLKAKQNFEVIELR